MPGTLPKGVIPSKPTPITQRPLSNLDADKAAVAALAQGAINVENFTLPLYLCAMSSIQGTHEINSGGNSFYKGRVWPGMATTPNSKITNPNQQAYNTMFSVFIQEMLHLQLAANLATVLGVTPKFFNGTALENDSHGWGCYGPNNTIIPHIIDLQDTTSFATVKVNLGELKKEQVKLFLAIEQSHEVALKDIKQDAVDKYFPAVPFATDKKGNPWTAASTEADLPLFGTIGWMYNCLLNYLSIEYSDGKLLWEKMFKPANIANQRDLFNAASSSHNPEYPRMATQITASDPSWALLQAIDIITGICDQGEGGITNALKGFRWQIQQRIKGISLTDTLSLTEDVTDNRVDKQFQPDHDALATDYPDFDAEGKATRTSADADARSTGDELDHWERFNDLLPIVSQQGFMTWPQWFANQNAWEASLLKTSDYSPDNAPNIPTPEQVAEALNTLKKNASKSDLSKIVTGAIAGINTVLTQSWGDSSVAFPYPAMSGSGDRMSFYWAVTGEAPDLSVGVPAPSQDLLYHACQGLFYAKPGANCAALEVYHTCAGSNSCKAQGGCGFVQSLQGGNSCGAQCGAHKAAAKPGNSCSQSTGKGGQSGCGAQAATGQHTTSSGNKCGAHKGAPSPGNGCGQPVSNTGQSGCGTPVPTGQYTAPSDNKCATFGGCAVPISASQLYPSSGVMVLDDVIGAAAQPLGNLVFFQGDSVYDTAWAAYTKVMQSNGREPGEKPVSSPLRTALPPST